MAESGLPFSRTIEEGSDQIPEHFCEPCYEVKEEVKPVAGYCQDCDEALCIECFSGHLRRKLFRNHQLVDKSTKPKTKSTPQPKTKNVGEKCLLHHGETLLYFCHSHSQFCCKVCLKINHQACSTEEISKLARNVKDSQELENLNKQLSLLQQGFKDNLTKTGANEIIIQRSHKDARDAMHKLRDEFDKLVTETEAQADKVREQDFNKIENVSATCDIVVEQINKLTTNLDKLKVYGEAEELFISMKRAESQIKSLEENLDKLNTDNTISEYKFEPDPRVKAIFNDLKVLGQLSFKLSQTVLDSHQIEISLSNQKSKRPSHVKDVGVKFGMEINNCSVYGSLVLPNNELLITDWANQYLKLIDTKQDKIISARYLPGKPIDITEVKDNEFAVTIEGPPDKIKFFTLSKNSLSIAVISPKSHTKDIQVIGQCSGITYNKKDQTLVVTYIDPVRVEILDLEGAVIKCLDKDSTGAKLFSFPPNVALSLDMTEMYITDRVKHSVTLMTMNGKVKAVYKDNSLRNPSGICVHKSGLVYVVGSDSNTVHHLEPGSGKFKTILEQKDGLRNPLSISYCDVEDKMYIGMLQTGTLKVFQMK